MYRVLRFQVITTCLLQTWTLMVWYGLQVFKEDATGFFSQRVAESLGLQTVRQIRYSDYMAEDTGEVVFKMAAPHDTLKIMVKILQWSSRRHVTRCSQKQEHCILFHPSELRSAHTERHHTSHNAVLHTCRLPIKLLVWNRREKRVYQKQ